MSGRVITGFSKPYVAKYSNTGSTVTYTGGMSLARGVGVNIEPEVSESNSFYADNVEAESSGGTFTKGTLNLTVDGLKPDAETLVFGLPEPDTETINEQEVKLYKYNDNMKPPFVGVGFVTRYLSRGVTTYAPTVLTKVRFSVPKEEATTQEENIEYQTQELTGDIKRDDSEERNWKIVGEEQDSEEKAEEIIKHILKVTAELKESNTPTVLNVNESEADK